VSALIIALVLLVLIAIGIVVRLLIAELSKPAPGQQKVVRKTVVAAPMAGAATASVAATRAVPRGAAPGDAALAADLGIGAGTATALAERPVVAPTGRTRKARMRDVVERGDGVRISPWRRIRSAISLLVLVTVLGASAAAVVGGFVLLIALALDQAIN
jgi:hypothetical protein